MLIIERMVEDDRWIYYATRFDSLHTTMKWMADTFCPTALESLRVRRAHLTVVRNISPEQLAALKDKARKAQGKP